MANVSLNAAITSEGFVILRETDKDARSETAEAIRLQGAGKDGRGFSHVNLDLYDICIKIVQILASFWFKVKINYTFKERNFI